MQPDPTLSPQASPAGRTAPATVTDGAGATLPLTIYVWFSDIGTIRKWDTKPFPEGAPYGLATTEDIA